MEWHDLPAPLTPEGPVQQAPLAQAAPAPLTPAEPVAPESKGSGLKRAAMTAALSVLLLVGGGVAAVSAASPAPGSSTAPGTTNPSNGGTTNPSTRPNHAANGVNCPNMGASRGSSGGSSTTPNPAATPAT